MNLDLFLFLSEMVRTEPIEEEAGMMKVDKEGLLRRRGVNIERESIAKSEARRR